MDQASWNQKIIKNNGSFLQSWDWGILQERLGRKILRLEENEFLALLIKYPLPLGRFYSYSPRGPLLTDQSIDPAKNLKKFLEGVKSQIDKNAIFLRVEPQGQSREVVITTLRGLNFRLAPPQQPAETLILDLTKTESELLQNTTHGVRYSLRLAQRQNLEVRVIETTEEKLTIFPRFWKLFQSHQKRLGLTIYPEAYYREIFSLAGDCRSIIFLAYQGNNLLAAAAAIIFGNTVTYLYAASDPSFSKLRAPTVLLWNIIQYAKNRVGCSQLDFWGISERNRRWTGFSDFKKSFGGQITAYAGTWEKSFKPFWHRIYKLASGVKLKTFKYHFAGRRTQDA